jgi:hypothetical protein
MKTVRIPDPTENEFDPLTVIPPGEYLARLVKVEELPDNYDLGQQQYINQPTSNANYPKITIRLRRN